MNDGNDSQKTPMIYDLSRLITRVMNATPNGIDRLDFLLGRHFLYASDFPTLALTFGLSGPRLLSPRVTKGATEKVAKAWKESETSEDYSQTYEKIVARLTQTVDIGSKQRRRIVQPRPQRSIHVARALLRYAPHRGAMPEKGAPQGAIYLNATHFPLEWGRHAAWLDKRPDIRPVFFIHDVLPLQRPEWFWEKEPQRHKKRLALLARRGAAAIVTSDHVEEALKQEMALLGRSDLPIFRRAPPILPIFSQRSTPDPRLHDVRYFVVCGTIEPRKNHLLLFRVWKKLAAMLGEQTPKLIIIGKRGWKCDAIIQAMNHPDIHDHMIEVSGLATASYKRLLDHCTAVLAPSLAEGFGLTLAEARAAGAPAIVSDIPPFREQADGMIDYLSPDDEEGWLAAIFQKTHEQRPRRHSVSSTKRKALAQSEQRYIQNLRDFLQNL